MTKHHHRPKHSARYVWVLLGCAAALFWLWTLFLLPTEMNDEHGYGGVLWPVIAAGLHFIVGLVLLFAAEYGRVGGWFAILVMLSPLLYLAGAVLEVPLCLILFTAPPTAILIMAFFELRPTRA